jgi:ankyrin repeat protein
MQDRNEEFSTAVYEGRLAQVCKLLETKEVDIHYKNKSGDTALIIAVYLGYTEIFCLLLTKGADCNQKSKEDYTPLMLAADKGSLRMVRELLKYPIKIDEKSIWGNTAFMLASAGGHATVVSELLQYPVNIHCRNRMGLTAYDLAKRARHTAVTKVIDDHLTELKTYKKREKRIELFFLGDLLEKPSFLSKIKDLFFNKKAPAVEFPKELVTMIEEYAKPPCIMGPGK